MSLNFQQVYAKIRKIGQTTAARQQRLAEVRQRAQAWLQSLADQNEALRARIERARTIDPDLRCALPLAERLDACYPPAQEPLPTVLIAADGSQVAPDHHAPLLYSLLNVGAIVLQTGSGETPQVFTDSTLWYEEELYGENGLWSEEVLAQRRDLAERRKLLELAQAFQGTAPEACPLITLTDGPLELWGAKEGSGNEYRRSLETYLAVLSQLQAQGAIVAGYVDKPGADLLVRLLEIGGLEDGKMAEVRSWRPLRGVTDRWLVGQFLRPGCRSAIFGLQSGSCAHYRNALALHFFYLNVGDERHPYLVRVEIPCWVAEDAPRLNVLHAALLEQCRLMGSRPYPYILHRAHEIAVVTFEEQRQVEHMLAVELRRAGGEVEGESCKQSAKNLPGRLPRP